MNCNASSFIGQIGVQLFKAPSPMEAPTERQCPEEVGQRIWGAASEWASGGLCPSLVTISSNMMGFALLKN